MRIFLGGIISALLMSWTAHATDWVYETIPAEDGVPLVVAETGNPDGPSILFIHGFSQSICFKVDFEG